MGSQESGTTEHARMMVTTEMKMVKSHPLSQQESTSTRPVCVHCPDNHLNCTFSVVSELLFHWLTQLYSKQQGWEAKRRDNRRETPAWEDRRMTISTVVTRWWSQNSDCSTSWEITERTELGSKALWSRLVLLLLGSAELPGCGLGEPHLLTQHGVQDESTLKNVDGKCEVWHWHFLHEKSYPCFVLFHN